MEKACLKNAKKYFLQMQKDRRYLHKNAEIGFELPKTAAYVETRLKELGYTPKRVSRCAIIAGIGQGKDGILLRADMDALPIKERSGEPFACKVGYMHACGHDLHAAMLLGAAAILREQETKLQTRVRLLFQPAEERLEGAKECVRLGVLEGINAATMLHVLPSMPFKSGTLIVSSGGVSAPAADFFDITVTGKGCHGSSPWQGVDGLLVGAKIVSALEVLSSREISPLAPTTLTIGKFQAGDAGNVIAAKALLSGTLRSLDEKAQEYAKKRLQEISQGVAKTLRARARVQFRSGCPCLQNDEKVSDFALGVAKEAVGKEKVIPSSELPKGGVGGSEDFAYIAQKIPSVMVGICAGSRGQGFDEPLHSPRVRFDEECMPYGAAYLAAFALGAETLLKSL